MSRRPTLCGWDLVESWMTSSRVVWASGCQCQCRNSLGFDPSILRHSGIWEAANEAVLNNVHKKEKNPMKAPLRLYVNMDPGSSYLIIFCRVFTINMVYLLYLLYSTLIHSPSHHILTVSVNYGIEIKTTQVPLHWQSDALTSWLNLIHKN